MGFLGRRVRVHAVLDHRHALSMFDDLLKIPSIVPQVIATIAIQANQGRVLRTDTTLDIVSPFIRRKVVGNSQVTTSMAGDCDRCGLDFPR